MPRASVIVATYNQPEYLRLVLASLSVQTARDFEVIVSDDGSRPDTGELVASLQKTSPFPLKYHWQEDTGYRLAEARNAGIRIADSDWMIFIDGDMVLHRRFVEAHLALAAENRLLLGGRVKLTQEFSRALTPEDVLGEGITRRYYREYATCREKDYAPIYEKAHHKLSSAWIQRLGGTYIGGPLWIGDAIARAVPRPVYMKVAFKIGANFSTSRKVLERVNGFDRQFDGLSGEDGEFFWRCFNAGVVPRSVVLRAIGYHLWHREQWQRVGEQRDRSLGIERATREGKRTRAVHGLVDERSGSPSVASAP
ncbi:MAG: glycosyltransferase [Myxococcales bacterium]|nr:glycosyltransferase [Myxococcales bacterium]